MNQWRVLAYAFHAMWVGRGATEPLSPDSFRPVHTREHADAARVPAPLPDSVGIPGARQPSGPTAVTAIDADTETRKMEDKGRRLRVREEPSGCMRESLR